MRWLVLAALLWGGSALAYEISVPNYGSSISGVPFAIALEKGFFMEEGADHGNGPGTDWPRANHRRRCQRADARDSRREFVTVEGIGHGFRRTQRRLCDAVRSRRHDRAGEALRGPARLDGTDHRTIRNRCVSRCRRQLVAPVGAAEILAG